MRKSIKVSEIPQLVKWAGLEDVGENQLDVYDSNYWTRDTEKEYNAVTQKLDKVKTKCHGYEIYVWYDISGYDYWVNNMKEENYA